MSVLRPRTRLVNFRLSVDEFDKLKASCSLHGARSVSDFARSSVLERMESQPHASAGRIYHLDHKVAELEIRVHQLLQNIPATIPAPAAPPPVYFEPAIPAVARSAASGD